MSLDFNDFININHHNAKIKRNAHKTKKIHSPLGDTSQYLHDLFDFFLKDIKDIANQIYDAVLHKKISCDLKFTASELKDCIQNGTQNFLHTYESVINGYNYNMGGMLRDYGDFEKDKASFKGLAEQACKKESELLYFTYRDLLKKSRRDFLTYVASIVARITGVIGVIVGVIAIFLGQ